MPRLDAHVLWMAIISISLNDVDLPSLGVMLLSNASYLDTRPVIHPALRKTVSNTLDRLCISKSRGPKHLISDSFSWHRLC